MKRIGILLFTILYITSCSKKNDPGCMSVPPGEEASSMAAFCKKNSIIYTVDSNGIYYQVLDQGSGITPNDNSIITATYIAKTLDGNVIEDNSTTPVTSPLYKFIEGWRIAIPYIQKGGHIKMVIPSSLAFGCTGSDKVAPNSPVYYDVVLIDVN
ncbi:MAG: FKBP-type peptidyl-prolyl cis-trans isomerase [Parafilimonas sp.]|nr:FKBP-type peptidyl-prolyl cis-trans isomerase [Parafilimonas sp.]